MESGEGTGEWSFIGIANTEVKVPEGDDGLLFMRDFVRRNVRHRAPDAPPFTSGFVGFVSYDLGAEWQGVPRSGQGRTKICPRTYFVYVDTVIAFRNRAARPSHSEALNEVKTERKINLNIAREEYFKKIHDIKKYLYAGDTYQVNFSQRFEAPFSGDAFSLYQKITSINPSPFQFFLDTDHFAVISNSPERLFKISSQTIETRPIKGTVPRGKTLKEDERRVAQLLASPKEHAELAMIVDLSRNDLGKICKPGSVVVNENRAIEKYSHVIHTVSNVKGVMNENCDWYDALRALFPGGSVTGCPKKRTMEIIDELEGESRGLYCGSAGYISLTGECDFNIMIRSAFVDKKPGNAKIVFRAGGGIVVDSNAEKEYEESLHKAQVFLKALQDATSRE